VDGLVAKDGEVRGMNSRLVHAVVHRVVSIVASYGQDAVIEDASCLAGCCVITLSGPRAAHARDEFDTSAGVFGWATSVTVNSETAPGGLEWAKLCFSEQDDVPEDFVDRLYERNEILARVEDQITGCYGAAGSPGTVETRLEIFPNGKDMTVEISGEMSGTAAAACVENLLYATGPFRSATGPSVLKFTLRVE